MQISADRGRAPVPALCSSLSVARRSCRMSGVKRASMHAKLEIGTGGFDGEGAPSQSADVDGNGTLALTPRKVCTHGFRDHGCLS